MKLVGITLAFLVVVVLADPKKELNAGTRTFSGKLYKELIKTKPNQNVLFSPISTQTIMSLLASAAVNENDDVMRQITTTLSLPTTENNRRIAFKKLLESFRSDNDFKVIDVNKMYFTTGYSVKDWYRNIAQSVYGAEIETVNFGLPQAASQNINQWVATKTGNRITNFVASYGLSANTRNLLINSLFLRGKWDKPFEASNNIIKAFHSPTGAKQVTMMTTTKTYNYYEDNNAQYLKLEMVRERGGAEMVFVLPKQQQGLSTLESRVEELLKIVPFSPAMVQVTLPKFSFSNSINLKPVLQNIGLTKLFRMGAHLAGLRYLQHGPGHIYLIVTDVFQSTNIDVNEWGVTAAASTADITASQTTRRIRYYDVYSSDSDDEVRTVQKFDLADGKFVVVKFAGRRIITHYVGQVLSEKNPNEYTVSFLRKKGSKKFVFPDQQDIGVVDQKDIAFFLSKPQLQRNQYFFSNDEINQFKSIE